MKDTFGEALGAILAILEEELRTNPNNTEALDKIYKISEIYRNFNQGDFREFGPDFEQGYDLGKSAEILNRETVAEQHERIYGPEPT